MSKYRDFSGPYFSVFGLNKSVFDPNLFIFHVVAVSKYLLKTNNKDFKTTSADLVSVVSADTGQEFSNWVVSLPLGKCIKKV